MKTLLSILLCAIVMIATPAVAQKIDEARMERDIEVAENILKTLVRQQFDRQRMFFNFNVEGSYQEGYGITFRFPADFTTPIAMIFSGDVGEFPLIYDGRERQNQSFSLSTRIRETQEAQQAQQKAQEAQQRVQEELALQIKGAGTVSRTQTLSRSKNTDSIRQVYNEKFIATAKDFLLDYGDLINQLGPNEKIVITNRGDQPRIWVNQFFTSSKRSHLSVEIARGDITAHKQGKLTRDQALNKITVVNTESVDTVEPDLELLSSIFNRLYRSDLSNTFFTDEGIYYERLKDFGAVYYMRVYSSNQIPNSNLFNMPTIRLREVDQAARDKKVKELYPDFEKEIRENVVEYGRTVKSLGDNESLVFNVKLTKCEGCGIPSSLELSVKGNVLKDYASGKITKEAAIGKVAIKKGQVQ
ncbi:MAG: hypothetical protein KF845_13210 [Cyclobacteriaceae bacterium]|nr:hypothetical protein [Cyclobacteriaceae bacterium]